MLYPTIYVYPGKIYFRQGFKKNTLNYNEGTFKLVEKKRFTTFNVALKFTRVLRITYTPNNKPKREIHFGWILKTEDVQEIFDYIGKQQNNH